MALADSVPGVSGGTVAFLLGFYDKFIMSLDYLMSGTKEERIEAIKFLIGLALDGSLEWEQQFLFWQVFLMTGFMRSVLYS